MKTAQMKRFSPGYTSAAFNGRVPIKFSVDLLHFMDVEERVSVCVCVCLRPQKIQATCDSTFVLSNYEEQRGAERRSWWPWCPLHLPLTVAFI